jgi:hypothetical protein
VLNDLSASLITMDGEEKITLEYKYRMPKKHKHNTLRDRFCRCIKAVRTTIKPQNVTRRKKTAAAVAAAKESAAIAVCVRSVLGARGKTLRKFSCRKKQLQTKAV